jgi:hypothetical protein
MGFSLGDVHAVTAIPVPCLAALEEGRLAALPSPVYARGYVRSYAEAVRLDGDRLALELWRCFDAAQIAGAVPARPTGRPPVPPPAPGSQPRRAPRPTNGTRPSPLTPLRQPDSPWVPKPGRIKRAMPALERVAVGALVLVLGVGIWDLQRARPTRKPPARAAGVASQGGDAVLPPESASVPTPSPTAPVGTTPSADNGSQATYVIGHDHFAVVVQATDAACWVLVRAAPGGPALFTGTLQPGESRPFAATGTLWVRVGDVAHAGVRVDGAALTLPNKPALPYNLLLQR